MKQLIRIPIGIMFSPIVLFFGTWIWLFEKDTNWIDDIGISLWHLISGQWDKFLD